MRVLEQLKRSLMFYFFLLIIFSGIAFAEPAHFSVGDHQLAIKTERFETDNIFVRASEKLTDRKITITLPETMTTVELMEALMVAHLALTEAAKSVTLLTEGPLRQVAILDIHGNTISLHLNNLFASAGVHRLKVGKSHIRKLNPEKLKIPHQRSSDYGARMPVLFDTGVHPQLAKDLSRELQIPVVSRKDDLDKSDWLGRRVFLIAPAAFPVNDELFKAIFLIKELRELGADVIYVTPYLPYARSDKIDQPGISVGGSLVASLIETSQPKSIVFVRAHAPQSQGFFRIASLQVSGRKTINHFLEDQQVEVIVSPDAGFQKDAKQHADELGGLPVSVALKKRDPITGKIEVNSISGDSVAGKVAAIIDDETASGSTLHSVAKLLKEKGARRVIAVVSHLSGGAEKAVSSEYIDDLAVTDTIPISPNISEKVKRLSIAHEISEALKTFLTNPSMLNPGAQSSVAVANTREVNSVEDYVTLMKAHITRVRILGLKLLKLYPEIFEGVPSELLLSYLSLHDQAKVEISIDFLKKHRLMARSTTLASDLYSQIYGVSIRALPVERRAPFLMIVQELNQKDEEVGMEFFKMHRLLLDDGSLSVLAEKLKLIEHIADISDRVNNRMSPEELGAILPEEHWFSKPEVLHMALHLKSVYEETVAGFDYRDLKKTPALYRECLGLLLL